MAAGSPLGKDRRGLRVDDRGVCAGICSGDSWFSAGAHRSGIAGDRIHLGSPLERVGEDEVQAVHREIEGEARETDLQQGCLV